METFTSLSKEEMDILGNMIGKTFDKFKCDPFYYSPMAFGVVGIYVGGTAYRLTSLRQYGKHFFADDDIAVFRIAQVDDSEIKTFMDNGELVETPVRSSIVAIDIVNDCQTVEHMGAIQQFDYTVGIIFHLEDTREISFELRTWFSEMITISKGYRLLDKFKPIDDFLEEWQDCTGFTANCSRKVIALHG